MTVRLTDTHYLKRASAYSAPINGNDRLPIVYGDLTDGSLGIWEIPCLNSADWVYAFAGHEVLSVANGNSISVYENDLLLDPAMYVFDESNDYEGHGVIATIDFSTPKTGSKITVRGKGKPTATGGATLMTSIIDILYDFLTVESSFAASLFEATAKARASQIFSAQSYKAAGIISEDNVVWETITTMMGSFLGSAFINGEGGLTLDIDINTIPFGFADVLRKGDAFLTDARIRRDNIINQCPCNYAYNYVDGEFKSETDASAHADAASQGIFGVRKPTEPYQFYWCRDLTSVQKVQDLIVAKLKGPLYEIEVVDATLKRIGVDIGDHILYSADRLYDSDGIALFNNYWKVLSVNPDYAKKKITFRALQTAHYLTIAYLADGNYLADGSIKAGDNRDMRAY